MSSEGYDVETAADGQEGIDKVRTLKPTLVLLDVMMPKMNGLEVLAGYTRDTIPTSATITN